MPATASEAHDGVNPMDFIIITDDGPFKDFKPGDWPDLSKVIEEAELESAAIKGAESAVVLLKAEKSLISFDGLKQLASALGPVFKWGQAGYSIVMKLTGKDKLSLIKKALKEILEELHKVEAAIRDGFAKLIAHDDAIYYRDKIGAPAQILFDSLQRHSSVLDQSVQEKFFQSCHDYPPVDMLSRLYNFLQMDENGLMTQLNANKFGYQTYKDWVGMMRADAVRCAIVQLYYDGMVMERDGTASADDVDYLVKQIEKLEQRFTEIDADRCLRFIECGEAQKLFRKVATEEANKEQGNVENDNPYPMLRAIQAAWSNANGPTPYSLHAFRGEMNVFQYVPRGSGVVRQADYKVFGNENRVVVVDNLYGRYHENGEKYDFPEPLGKGRNNDNINIVLIQPLTKEMVEKHMAGSDNEANIPTINGIIDSFFNHVHVPDVDWIKTQHFFDAVAVVFATVGAVHPDEATRPMLCLYTNERGDSKTSSESKKASTINPLVVDNGLYQIPWSKYFQRPTGFYSLDFTKSIRWERTGWGYPHFTKMNFSFIFM